MIKWIMCKVRPKNSPENLPIEILSQGSPLEQ